MQFAAYIRILNHTNDNTTAYEHLLGFAYTGVGIFFILPILYIHSCNPLKSSCCLAYKFSCGFVSTFFDDRALQENPWFFNIDLFEIPSSISSTNIYNCTRGISMK